MEPDCRSRQGQSYSSKRRRISNLVSSTLGVLAHSDECADTSNDIKSAEVELCEDFGCPNTHLVVDENSVVECASSSNACCSVLDNTDDALSISEVFSDTDSWDSCEPSDMSNNETDKPLLGAQLAQWSIDNNVPHSALSGLLRVLKPYHPGLPIDPRTLLKTPKTYAIKQIGQWGHYYHFGIASGITELLSLLNLDETTTKLSLQVNFDGLPLFKSSCKEFWPILCCIKEIDASPFVVGLYCGTKKPSSIAEYLNDFVIELCGLLESGVIVNNRNYAIQIDCFVCDAPARSFIKNVKSHNGYHGCEKCMQQGVYISNRMTFPETTAKLRNDSDFEKMIDEEHHHGPTPLSALQFGLVTGFVLDYMHLVCLGVVRKLLKFWLGGKISTCENSASRLSARTVQGLSDRLLRLAHCIPQEFARKPRALCEIDRWKATEFRQFILYTGPVVLSGVLSDNVYNHFMLLFCGITLLTSPLYCQEYADYAQSLLVHFVTACEGIYGADFLVYNVHGLTHLAEDVKRHGSLDSFSAFPFENQLKTLKRLVRKSGNPLEQCIRRLAEKRTFAKLKEFPDQGFALPKVEHSLGPVPEDYDGCVQFMQLKFHKYKINIKRFPHDCCVAIKENGPVLIVNILLHGDGLYVVCRPFKVLSDLFSYPLESSKIGVYKVNGLLKDFVVFRVSEIMFKCLCINNETAVSKSKYQYAVFPILHTTGESNI